MHASSVPHKVGNAQVPTSATKHVSVDSSADLSKQTAKRRKPPLARLFR